MKILFVWPNKDEFGFKPIGISLLSAILKREGHDVDLFDTTYIDFGFDDNTGYREKIKIFKKVDYGKINMTKRKLNVEKELVKKLEDFKPDIVGISALTDEIYIGLDISNIVKKWNKEIIVIWGNKAVTMTPKKILENDNVDYACVGEGIEFITEFVECISKNKNPRNIKNIAYKDDNGNIKVNELRPYYQDLDSLPFLDWSIFDKRHLIKPFEGRIYNGGDYMMFWGCPNHCTYCINDSYRKLYGNNAGVFLRKYSVKRIIKELKYLVDKWGITFFKFHDEDFCLKSIDYFNELAEEYKNKIDIPFTCMVNARNINTEKISLLNKMNCVSVSLGVETGNDKLRKEVLKRVETKEQVINATKMLNKAGIRTSSFNMLGLPFESRETVMETIKLNREAEIRYPNVTFFFPLEGTLLRKISIENGFFDDNSKAVFIQGKPTLTNLKISTKELIALRDRFVLYIKMPSVFHKYIKRSEVDDDIGIKITKKLYGIYDECVFANNGFWDDKGRLEEYLEPLRMILEDENQMSLRAQNTLRTHIKNI